MTDAQATKPAPCLICGKELEPVQASGTQPVGAITFHGSGQYGSRWDPMNVFPTMDDFTAWYLAERAEIEREIRADVSDEVAELDHATPLWADDEELTDYPDRDLTWWMNLLGHPTSHPGCCATCGCATTCIASAFYEAVLMTAARIARGDQ